MADGKEIKLDEEKTVVCKTINFIQHSFIDVFDQPGRKAAIHEKYYTINQQSIRIEQNLQWLRSMELECAYLGMLPLKRTAADVQIVDRAMLLDGKNKNIECNVSTEQSQTVVSDANVNTSRVKSWGVKSGISVVTEHLGSPILPGKMFHLKLRSWDNKFYYMFCGGHHTTIGEIWHTYTNYYFDIV